MMIFRETFWNTAYWEERGIEYWLDSLFVENIQWQILVPAFLMGFMSAFFIYSIIKLIKTND